MALGCSYCRRAVGDVSPASPGVTHAMCPDCADRFERLWHGTVVAKRLEAVKEPVLMLTPDARVVAANSAAATQLRRDPAELRGLCEGEALACVHAVEPGSCGKSSVCRECTVRRAVARVAETGVPLDGVAANVTTGAGRLDLRLDVYANDGLVKVVVEELSAAHG
jgi:hypothetical protein